MCRMYTKSSVQSVVDINSRVDDGSVLPCCRHHLRGENEGQTEVFIDNLPGLPDNIRPSSHGGYWVGIATVRKDPFFTDLLMQYPRARRFLTKVTLTLSRHTHTCTVGGGVRSICQTS